MKIYIELIEKLHQNLRNCEDMCIKKKLELCNRERYYMKVFLRGIINKIQKNSTFFSLNITKINIID